MEREHKSCKDCKHFRLRDIEGWIGVSMQMCAHPSFVEMDNNGKEKLREHACSDERGVTGTCSINGFLWEKM